MTATAPVERATYTVPEVAQILGCSETHVYELINRNEIPHVPHMGRRRLVPRHAVERLLGIPEA